MILSLLALLIVLSAFFSSSETGMMSINRYRLKHLAQQNHRGAKKTLALLERPDRLIGLILIGNNFVNILASALATLLAVKIWGEAGIAVATATLTIVLLIFGEVTPKTLAALRPERIAFPAAHILAPLLILFYPLVWFVNIICQSIISLMGGPKDKGSEALNREELRTIVLESKTLIPRKHRTMLLSILDLENMTVEDVMVQRNDIIGIDIEDSMEDIQDILRSVQHTRLPIYKGNLNQPLGILHARKALKFMMANPEERSKEYLVQCTAEPYYIPESTQLMKQLSQFQRTKSRIGLVVDEYGDVKGLLTLEDILEEIVGEFTTNFAASSPDIHPQKDGSYIIEGSATLRDINRRLKWKLPIDGPKTVSGLITEYLEFFPHSPLCLKINEYYIEVIQTKDTVVKTARFFVEPST
ncbi:MAG: HlyC/CorC family transporter [Pseudomonadota bacterium]